jgi:endonuclease/exonuclease/phosphatase family metal-dependent hydrolase
MASIKLVSLNVEHGKHVEIVLPFLMEQQADVICLQEVVASDLKRYANELGMEAHFGPQCLWTENEGDEPVMTGEAILSKKGFISKELKYYGGTQEEILVFDRNDKQGSNERLRKVLVIGAIEKDSVQFSIATTHAVWTPGAGTTDLQRREFPLMLKELEAYPDLILTGDFNAPRGGEMFALLAAAYKDNIPPEYVTSLDGNIHRAGTEKLAADALAAGVPGQMVDGLFTTPAYVASDVQLIPGVSDHVALVATASRVM